MFKFFSLFAILIATSSAFSIQAKSPAVDFIGRLQNPRPCSNPGSGQLKEVRISGCSVQPCVFIPNQQHEFTAVFTAGHHGESVQLIVNAVLGGIPFEIISAPFETETFPGSDYAISMTVTVTNELSGVAFILRSSVFARPGTNLHVCAEIDARVA